MLLTLRAARHARKLAFMAPLLRHPVGELPAGTLPLTTTPHRLVKSTLISYEGLHGDCSFLLIRERPGPVSSGERIVLRGDFGAAAHGRLASLLAALPAADRQPLHFDLRRVTSLHEGCLSLLLKARRDQAVYRPVIFQVAEIGPVREMINLLGLEKRLGLEKKPFPKAAPALPALLTASRLKTLPALEGRISSAQPVQ